MIRLLLVLFLFGALAAGPVPAQGRGHKKEFVVAPTRAMSVTREILVHQGYVIIRTEKVKNDQIVYYRRGNMGKGKGQGPPLKLIIRRVENRVVFVDTPDAVLVDINVRLKL